MSLATTALALVAAASAHTGAMLPRVHAGTDIRQRQRSHRPHEKPVARAAIVGGAEAREGTFPWLAYFTDNVELGSGEKGGTCSGTVVAPDLVLTAAHCVENPETGTFYKSPGYVVVTGTVEPFSRKTQASTVSRVIVYPGFTRSTGTGDVALLVLSKPSTAPPVSLITTPSDAGILQAGTEAMIAGWGRTSYTNLSSVKRLRWANTVVQSVEWCGLNASPFDDQDQLCAISDSTTVCYGDSGGPLLAESPSRTEEVEIGVISRNEGGECSPRNPTVFTRADVIASWVDGWIETLKPTPPNDPGYYVTRPSKARQVVIHVSADGGHVVGLRVKMPVSCQHDYYLPSLEESFVKHIPITNHVARAKFATQAEGEYKVGHISVYVLFTGWGTLEGRLSVDLPTRSRRFGRCSGTLKFTAKT
jgi:secreted trypsin-like serine protease